MCGRKWLGPTQAGLSVFFGLEEACLSQLSCLLPSPSPAARVLVIRAWLYCVVRADMAAGLQLLMGDDLVSCLEHSSLENASRRQGGAEKLASVLYDVSMAPCVLGQWHLGMSFSCSVLVQAAS